ncbi:MAG: UDP-galactose-lipid carrier transferase [Actinomycetota bacterium]|nr:UDP-galactose-lipid carrier transferase [Actinomycetota bacterium]
MGQLDAVDLTLKLSGKQGRKRLKRAQRRLLELRLQAGGQLGGGQLGPPLAIVFEGWDASGKGGAIRRLTAPLDARHVTVTQFATPSEREKRHHFLWRFSPALPGWGGMSVLDRSWYGRVLVERVEGFATKAEWSRAYDQIVAFERGLCEEGMVLVKFWMHLSDQEQLRRFQAREHNPLKSWKLTDEDWRNREKRKPYLRAVQDMLRHTDHPAAPWHLIAGDSKRYARVAVIETVIAALEQGLRDVGQEPLVFDAD